MRNWGFNKKVALSSLTVVSSLVLIAFVAIAGIFMIERLVDNQYRSVEYERTLSQISIKLKNVRLLETDAILESDADLLSTYPKLTADLFKDLEQDLNGLSARADSQLKRQSIEELRAFVLKRKELSENILKSAVAGDQDKALELFDEPATEEKGIHELTEMAVLRLGQDEAARTTSSQKDLTVALKNWLYGVVLVALACVSLVPSIVHSNFNTLRRNVARTLDNMQDSTHKIEPLLQRLKNFGSKFQQGHQINQTSLDRSGQAIKTLAETLMSHAESTGQAAECVALNADHTHKINNSASAVQAALGSAQSNNEALIEKLEAYTRRIEEVTQSVTEVSQKTKVISDFIFQTKIISFNASVEAARAGEAGRGFSIVAEELSHLSQSTGQSAKDITTSLSNSLVKIESLLNDSHEDFKLLLANNREVIGRGSSALSECTEKLESLGESTQSLADIVGEAGGALQRQLEHFSSISQALTNLKDTAVNATELTEGYTSAVHQLSEQSENITGLTRNLMAVFQGTSNVKNRSRMREESRDDAVLKDLIAPVSKEASTDLISPSALSAADRRRKRSKNPPMRKQTERTLESQTSDESYPSADREELRRKA